MEWNVYKYDLNKRKFYVFNVFDNIYLYEFMQRPHEDFEKELDLTCKYAFWSKMQYEIVITFHDEIEHCTQIDVYDQLKLNWDKFVSYCKGFEK